MFAAYQDELYPRFQTPVTAPDHIEQLTNPGYQPPAPQAPSVEADYDEIAIEDFGAYLAATEQSAPTTTPQSPEAPSVDMAGIDLSNLLGLIGNLLGDKGTTPSVSPENYPDSFESSIDEDLALQFVAKRRLNIKPFAGMNSVTRELVGNQSSRRKFATIGGLALVAVLGFNVQSHRDQTEPSQVRLAAPASLINQGAVIASIELQSQATVRIPVAGFSKPLLFKEKGQAVEPATTLNDTISVTLAPRLDKKGNALPIAVVKNSDTLVVDRSNIDVIANFDNFLGLNIDCLKDATTVNRYCVAGSPIKLKASGNFKAATANQLNDLLTINGKNFDTYYRGVEAQLAVAGLAKVEQDTYGSEIFGLADQVIKSLLQKQSATAKIQFAPNSHYPSISQAYAKNFTSLVANKTFSIERGDSVNAIPDSLHVTCKVTPPITKGAKK